MVWCIVLDAVRHAVISGVTDDGFRNLVHNLPRLSAHAFSPARQPIGSFSGTKRFDMNPSRSVCTLICEMLIISTWRIPSSLHSPGRTSWGRESWLDLIDPQPCRLANGSDGGRENETPRGSSQDSGSCWGWSNRRLSSGVARRINVGTRQNLETRSKSADGPTCSYDGWMDGCSALPRIYVQHTFRLIGH